MRNVLAPVIGLGLLALLLSAAGWCRLLPVPEPSLDPDQTLLFCKSQASRSKHSAEIILVGDSSCAAGVEAPLLGRLLPGQPAILNLGLIIGLSLDAYGEALTDFVEHNPGQVRLAVLLVTPQRLKSEDASSYHLELWERFRRSGQLFSGESASIEKFSGLPRFRQQISSYLLNRPLNGKAGSYYGFTAIFRDYLAAHHGSMVDPGTYEPPRRRIQTEYFLSPALEKESRTFRSRLPPGVKFVIGLTPVPESHVGREFELDHKALLRRWNQWLHADLVLTNLPARLPDGLFANGGHLNERGQQRFTRLLAKELEASGLGQTFPTDRTR